MTKAERDRVREIINLWMVYQDKQAALDEICRSGPTQESKMIEFRGDFPQLSNIKPEILIGKADKMRKFEIYKEERRANVIISAFPDQAREILTAYEQKKKKRNKIAQHTWTKQDIACLLRLDLDRYKVLNAYYSKLVLEVDKAQDVVSYSYRMHNILKKMLA